MIAAIEQHAADTVREHRIPDQIQQQFHWLSAGDISAKQVLLNHIRGLERNLALQAAHERIPLLLSHMRSAAGEFTHMATQTLTVGKHRIDIVLDRTAYGIRVEDPQVASPAPRDQTIKTDNSLLWVLVGIAFMILLLGLR